MVKTDFDERKFIVYQLLEVAKANKLNKVQKQELYNIVYNLERTEKQKEKFFRFYNLLEGQEQNYRLCDMARFYNCSPGNIKTAIGSIKNSLINLKDEKILLILKAILDECINKK